MWLMIDGHTIGNTFAYNTVLLTKKPAQRVVIKVQRGAQIVTLNVVLGKKKYYPQRRVPLVVSRPPTSAKRQSVPRARR